MQWRLYHQAMPSASSKSSRDKGTRKPASQGTEKRRTPRMRTVAETSAGGLVVDTETGHAAVIGRLDRRGRLLWSLPKGHVEQGETVEQAAVREVAEETGINSAVVAALGSIDYWFVAEDRRIHKTVHHFLLRAVGGKLSDADYEVAEVAWVPLADLPSRLAYADERRLVQRATTILADSA
jgi:ADP-ribose pyrophosphatase YjhB (NUDIX family)